MTKTLALFGAAALLSACASSPMMKVDNAALPEAVRVPAGQKMMMATTGVGEITYECREKKDMAGAHEWAFVAPVATLYAADRKVVGKYYAGPTWESADGSKVTGKQLAVAPASAGQHSPATGEGRAGDGRGRDARRELHPAPEHQGRRGPGDGLRRSGQGQASASRLRGGLRVLRQLKPWLQACGTTACVAAGLRQ